VGIEDLEEVADEVHPGEALGEVLSEVGVVLLENEVNV
jgi:hypothetical protein